MTLRFFLAFLLLDLCVLSAEAANRIVAQTGQAAPGTTGQFSQFFLTADGPIAPVLNNAGRVAFSATLTTGVGGVTAPNDTGIWSEGNGTLSLVAREGHSAPGGPAGALFRRAANPVINSSGAVAFAGLLRENVAGVTLENNSGIWSNAGGLLQLIAREGTQAVGAPAGVEFATLIDPTLNDAGDAVFRGSVRGVGVDASNEAGVWMRKGGTLNLISRAGQWAPGTAAGSNFQFFLNGYPSTNNSGDLAFRGLLKGQGVNFGNDIGIWAQRNDAMSLVAREGSQASGLEVGRVYSGLTSDPAFNSLGNTAFVAKTAKANNEYSVIYTENGGALTPVVTVGELPPGGSIVPRFSDFSSLLLNRQGDIAFRGLLTGGNIENQNEGVWVHKQGSLQQIALQGMPAPGLLGASFNSFSELAFNGAGQVAFVATLSGPAFSEEWNDSGIWATTPSGELRLIAHEGMPIADGILDFCNGLYFAGGSGNGDGQRSGFNDRGELAFLATFITGANKIVVSDAVALSPGDFNGNGAVDGADFLAWQRGYGKTTGALPQHGDANRDGDVDAADLATWRSAYGGANAASAASAVPEPSTGTLLWVGAAALMAAVRRRPDR